MHAAVQCSASSQHFKASPHLERTSCRLPLKTKMALCTGLATTEPQNAPFKATQLVSLASLIEKMCNFDVSFTCVHTCSGEKSSRAFVPACLVERSESRYACSRSVSRATRLSSGYTFICRRTAALGPSPGSR